LPFWEVPLRRRGFRIAPLQAEWVRDRLKLSETDLLQDLRMLLADGSQIVGADVYRYAMRRIWWAWPMYLFSITPGARQIFNWGYRTFAANRFRVSTVCRLPGKH
jgi:predicted DCC family thiol-disulfide oxidoreductase YuxK